MQKLRIKAHYLEAYNMPTLPKYQSSGKYQNSKKSQTIELLLDWETRDKIRNVVNSLTGYRDDNEGVPPKPKSPLHKQGDDNLLTVSLPDVAHYELNGQPVESIKDLLGNEIELEIKLTKYQLVSKFDTNKGQKIVGVSAKLIFARTT